MAARIIGYTLSCRRGASTPSSCRTGLSDRMSSAVRCIEGGLAETNVRAFSTPLKVRTRIEENIRAGGSDDNSTSYRHGDFGLAIIETVGRASCNQTLAAFGRKGRR